MINYEQTLDELNFKIDKSDFPDWSYKTEKASHRLTKFHLRNIVNEINNIHKQIEENLKSWISKKEELKEQRAELIWYLEWLLEPWIK